MKERLIKWLGGVPKREHEAWLETAAQFSRNADYYRGLLVKIGMMFGDDAKRSDDGSMQEDVLCAKVPLLVTDGLFRHCEENECSMERGHGGPHRFWHGLAFSTMHRKEMQHRRAERDRKALEELTAKPAGVSQ